MTGLTRNQARYGNNDDRCQHGLRHVVQHRGQKQQSCSYKQAGHDGRKTRDRASGQVHRGAGKRAGNRIALKKAGRQIAQALTQQFLIGIQMLASFPHRHRLGNGKRLHEANQGNGNCNASQVQHIAKINGRQYEVRQTFWD